MDNILMNGSKKFGSFIIGPHIFPQRTKFPVHWHDYFEFEFVVEGTGENCHNNIKQIVEAGSAYLMSYYDFHSFETITEMKIINVRFNENMLPAELVNFLLLGTCNIACRFDPDESRYILNLLHMLEDEKKQGKQFSSLATTDQENYIADVSNSTMFLAIPKSNRSPGASATAIDALTYMSYSQVMPIYYDQYISYRGLNDKDSLEMLNKYIMPGRIIDRGILYNWTNDFVDSYNQAIFNGTSYSNLVAINTKPVNSKIKSFFSGS